MPKTTWAEQLKTHIRLNTLLSYKYGLEQSVCFHVHRFELPTFSFSMANGFIYHMVGKKIEKKLTQKLPSFQHIPIIYLYLPKIKVER